MAINYTEVGWDTTKYVNPTNMNQMDDGIKAACDGVDDLDSTKLDNSGDVTYTGRLTISTSSYGGPLIVKGNSNGSCIQAGIASGSSEGFLRLYKGDTAYYSQIRTNTNTANRTIMLPDASGTAALTSDIPDIAKNLNWVLCSIPLNTFPLSVGSNTIDLSNDSITKTVGSLNNNALQICIPTFFAISYSGQITASITGRTTISISCTSAVTSSSATLMVLVAQSV